MRFDLGPDRKEPDGVARAAGIFAGCTCFLTTCVTLVSSYAAVRDLSLLLTFGVGAPLPGDGEAS